jgi:hypothetical protein
MESSITLFMKRRQQQLSKQEQRRQQELSIDQLKAFRGDFYKIDRQNNTRQLLKEPNHPFGNQEVASIRASELDTELFSKDIPVLSEQEFNKLKEASIQEAAGANIFVADTFLGAGHYMYTRGTVDSNGLIRASTRTRTITWFGGYHGGVYCIAADANDIGVAQTPLQRYGVDGTAIGRADRTDYWSANIGIDAYSRAKKIYCFHTWAPDDMVTRINRASAVGKAVGEFIRIVADIVKYIISLFAG